MNCQLGQPPLRRASLTSIPQRLMSPPNLGKKSGRSLTPKRPAFAFLVTPKLPLGGRSVKT
jgi:hypothetical protein